MVIGLNLEGSIELSLRMKITLPFCHCWGTSPDCSDSEKNPDSQPDSSVANFFRNQAGKSSWPCALSLLIVTKALRASCSLTSSMGAVLLFISCSVRFKVRFLITRSKYSPTFEAEVPHGAFLSQILLKSFLPARCSSKQTVFFQLGKPAFALRFLAASSML